MRIYGFRTDESVANRFGTDRSWVNNNQQHPEFVETVRLPTIVCGLDIPKFMEDG